MSEAPEIRGTEPWLVIGVGNPWRGDDAAGLHVVERLRKIAPNELRTATCTGSVDELLELWESAATVVVVDAIVSGRESGLVVWLDAIAGEIPAGWFPSFSTHSFGLHEALRLGRVLRRLPPRLFVCGIEAARVEIGRGLSEAVEEGVERAAAMVLERRAASTRVGESTDA
jgi:hydrogenase maturation protease